jgi:hypothetical protein
VARERLGRAVFALGLLVMLGALLWGLSTDQLGTEIVVFVVGLLLCMTGRGLGAASRER